MRCQDCNENLTDEESTRKDERTGQYLDLCNTCLSNLYKDLDEYNSYTSTNSDNLDDFRETPDNGS